MKDPFSGAVWLMLTLWRDAIFLKLIAMVFAFATGYALLTDAEWEIIFALVGLGCLAAMLEVTMRSR